MNLSEKDMNSHRAELRSGWPLASSHLRMKRYSFHRNRDNIVHDESNSDYLLHALEPQPPSVEERDLSLQNQSYDPAVSTVNSQLICASHQVHTPSHDKDLQDSSHDSSESDMRIHECELVKANAVQPVIARDVTFVATNCLSPAGLTD